MINAVEVLTAWDKTLETQDFDHLRKYLSDDFRFENTQGEINNLEHTKSWCIAGALRIDNFKMIREHENEGYLIRANQGHTLKVVDDDALLEPVPDSLKEAVHGNCLMMVMMNFVEVSDSVANVDVVCRLVAHASESDDDSLSCKR